MICGKWSAKGLLNILNLSWNMYLAQFNSYQTWKLSALLIMMAFVILGSVFQYSKLNALC